MYYILGETLYIYVNKIKERTLKIIVHRSCLIEAYVQKYIKKWYGENNDQIAEPLDLIVKANDTVIFSDKLTNKDLEIPPLSCTTSECSYTSKEPPKIEVLINGELFRTYEKYEVESRFYEGDDWEMLFGEHGAG